MVLIGFNTQATNNNQTNDSFRKWGYYLQIVDVNYIPRIVNKNSLGYITLQTGNSIYDSVFEKYKITEFYQNTPTASSLFLRQIYALVCDSGQIQLGIDLKEKFSNAIPFIEIFNLKTELTTSIPYVPFPTENASWSEIHVQQGSCEPAGYCKYQYKMLGDTTISSIQYHKIYKQDDSLAITKNAVYLGAIREESKKIYYRSSNCNQDIRIYDFSKNVGDTIKNLYSSSNICGNSLMGSGTITAIDTVLIDGSYRRAFHLEFSKKDYLWIEGIGCTNGLFNPVVPQLTCACFWYLICYHQNNQAKFVNNDSQLNYVAPRITCFPSTIDGVNTPAEKKSFTVSPNPVKDILIVQFTSENVSGATMEVINVLGKRVKTISISNSSEYKLDLTDCSAGIYYVMLKYKNKTESQKIIKM